MFDASTAPRSRSGIVLVTILAVIAGVAGIALTTHALLWKPSHPPLVRSLDAAELPADLPVTLAPDAVATRQIVGMLDTLRHMDRKPHHVDWVHFRCVEAALVLRADLEGDPTTFRDRTISAFPPSWNRIVGKDADMLTSPDGRTEIAIPFGSGRDAIDEVVVGMRPAQLVALAYHLRPC
jgi:hypothetical protein